MDRKLDSHTLRRHPLGSVLSEILHAALQAADARTATRDWARRTFATDVRLWVLAAGKASVAMAQGLRDACETQIAGGVVVAKHPAAAAALGDLAGDLTVVYGAHPYPTLDSVRAAAQLELAARRAPPGATVVGLLSGGASALVTAPTTGTSVEEIAELTATSLRGGVDIQTLNAARTHLDRLKRGGLGRLVPKSCPLHAAVIGDIVGGSAHDVGSGLLEVERCQVTELRNNGSAVAGAADKARALGLEVNVLPPMLGSARAEGIRLARDTLSAPASDVVRCTVAGGETRVIVRGDGRGGRNQELALAAAPQLMGHPHALLATLATDGEDGPTDAAGAVAAGDTVVRALQAGVDPDASLQRNDAYRFFDGLGDLLRPGPTQTNVCDVTVLLS